MTAPPPPPPTKEAIERDREKQMAYLQDVLRTLTKTRPAGFTPARTV